MRSEEVVMVAAALIGPANICSQREPPLNTDLERYVSIAERLIKIAEDREDERHAADPSHEERW